MNILYISTISIILTSACHIGLYLGKLLRTFTRRRFPGQQLSSAHIASMGRRKLFIKSYPDRVGVNSSDIKGNGIFIRKTAMGKLSKTHKDIMHNLIPRSHCNPYRPIFGSYIRIKILSDIIRIVRSDCELHPRKNAYFTRMCRSH